MAIALLFLARAIGDFRYLGFFKTVHGSLFAGRDTLYCLVLGALVAVSAMK